MDIIESHTVDRPGLYRMPEDVYHADPAPEPSLSASTAKVLLAHSPLHAWAGSSRLNPGAGADRAERKFDVGRAAHSLLLGEGADIAVVPFGDYRSKAAQAARDEAIAAGKTPLLSEQAERVAVLVQAVRDSLAGFPGSEDALSRGESELVAAWQDDNGIWCRARLDRLHIENGRAVIHDLKTSDRPLSHHGVSSYLANQDAQIQDAHYTRGIERVTGIPAHDIAFRFVLAEANPPYSVVVAELDAEAKTIGAKQMIAAASIWRRCLDTGHWPGLAPLPISVALPPWVESRWLERETNDAILADMGFDPRLRFAQLRPEPAPKTIAGPC